MIGHLCENRCQRQEKPWLRKRLRNGCASKRDRARSSKTHFSNLSARCGSRSTYTLLARIEAYPGLLRLFLSWSDMQARLFPSITTLSLDRKSTRLNSSHLGISYAVFCL